MQNLYLGTPKGLGQGRYFWSSRSWILGCWRWVLLPVQNLRLPSTLWWSTRLLLSSALTVDDYLIVNLCGRLWIWKAKGKCTGDRMICTCPCSRGEIKSYILFVSWCLYYVDVFWYDDLTLMGHPVTPTLLYYSLRRDGSLQREYPCHVGYKMRIVTGSILN